LDNSFKGLYDRRTSEDGEDDGRSRKVGQRFMSVFGWQYTVKQIAEHQRVTIEQVYSMPTIEALNSMSYLKGKQSFMKELERS